MAALPHKGAREGRRGGVYCAALPELGLGVALKVTDGDSDASAPALLAVLRFLSQYAGGARALDLAPVADHAERPIVNTRGARVGTVRAAGGLRFHD